MGSKQKTTNSIPAYVTQGGMEAINLARQIANMGYVPYIGPDVAMPGQGTLNAWQAQDAASRAFGLPASSATGLEGLPVANAGGITGYSSFPGYQSAVANLAAEYPGLYAFLSSLTIDPVTGQPAVGGVGGTGGPALPEGPRGQTLAAAGLTGYGNNGAGSPASIGQNSPAGGGALGNLGFGGGGFGGYTSIADMFNGGGPGASGSQYQGGGLLSTVGNIFGGPK